MSIPLNKLSTIPVILPEVEPYDREITLLTDWQRGGIALQDTGEGLNYQNWSIGFEEADGDIIVTPETTGSPTTVLTGYTEVTELSLAFDQNMRPFIAFVDGDVAKYYWYNPVIQANEVVTMEDGVTCPRCILDDVRYHQTNNARIILAYCRDGALRFRDQVDRFEVEYDLTETPHRLWKLAMTSSSWPATGRLAFIMEQPDNVIPPPVQVPVMDIPYWDNFSGGQVDLDLCTKIDYYDYFGAAVADDATIDTTFTVSGSAGTVPRAIRFSTNDGGNLIRVENYANPVSTTGVILITTTDGTIVSKALWDTNTPFTSELALPTGGEYYIVMAADGDEMHLRKRDVSPDTAVPPVIDPGVPPDISNAVSWEDWFGVPFNSPISGGVQEFIIPLAGQSLWFTVPDNQPPATLAFSMLEVVGNTGPWSIALNTTVGDYSSGITKHVPGLSGGIYVGMGGFTTGVDGTLESGRTYILNFKVDNPNVNANWVALRKRYEEQ